MGINGSYTKVAIMQPYFLPYIGYYQLMNAVDIFVVYDNIQYTKKGWINRNRFLVNSAAEYFTIPLKSDSDYLNINQRYLADNSLDMIKKALRQIQNSYLRAPQFGSIFPFVSEIFNCDKRNLFDYLHYSLNETREKLGIGCNLIPSSTLEIDYGLRGQERVINICKAVDADLYVNPIGGVDMYNSADFLANGIELRFLRTRDITYGQFENEFVPWLSILDILMFNTIDTVKDFVREDFELINGYDI